MIQPLRTVHRRAFVTLSVVLPLVLLVGLGARRPRPVSAGTAARVPDSAQLIRKSDSWWRKHAIRSEFYRDRDAVYVVLLPAQELNEPDLLVYWTGNTPEGQSLPADAQLLGAFSPGKAFALPSVKGSSHLVLFSLAHQSVVDWAAVEKMP